MPVYNGIYIPKQHQAITKMHTPPTQGQTNPSPLAPQSLTDVRIISFYFLLVLFYFGCAGSSLLCALISCCGEWGLLCSCSVWVSNCRAFSCRGAQFLGCVGFNSCGSWALERESVSRSVVSDSLGPHGLYPTRPGSSVHRILQARILKRVAILFSRGSSQPRIRPGSPVLQMDSLSSEPPGMSPRLKSTGLGYSAARGIFPNQGPNLCLLHW